MQSETANLASDATTRKIVRNIRVDFDSGQFAPLCENDVIHGSTWHIALSSKEERAAATGNKHRKFCAKIGRAVFEINKDRQTNKQTDGQTRWPQQFDASVPDMK